MRVSLVVNLVGTNLSALEKKYDVKRKICKRRQSADSHEIREPVPKHGGVSKARREVE